MFITNNILNGQNLYKCLIKERFAVFLPERQWGSGEGKAVSAKIEYFNDSIDIFIHNISEVFKPKFGQLD